MNRFVSTFAGVASGAAPADLPKVYACTTTHVYLLHDGKNTDKVGT